MIGGDHLPEIFRVQLPRQARRVHQITKQHRQLAARGGREGMGGMGV
jgi:hypothetical protein